MDCALFQTLKKITLCRTKGEDTSSCVVLKNEKEIDERYSRVESNRWERGRGEEKERVKEREKHTERGNQFKE